MATRQQTKEVWVTNPYDGTKHRVLINPLPGVEDPAWEYNAIRRVEEQLARASEKAAAAAAAATKKPAPKTNVKAHAQTQAEPVGDDEDPSEASTEAILKASEEVEKYRRKGGFDAEAYAADVGATVVKVAKKPKKKKPTKKKPTKKKKASAKARTKKKPTKRKTTKKTTKTSASARSVARFGF